MRVLSSVLLLASLCVAGVAAAEEARLIESVNAYRGEVQRCGSKASEELPPLTADSRLNLPVGAAGDLQDALSRAGYPMVTVQAITLSGPRDAQSAMQALRESFCRVILDPQFTDIGVSREGRDWRIVVARPLLDGRLGDWQVEGQKLLEQINTARASARLATSSAGAAAGLSAGLAPPVSSSSRPTSAFSTGKRKMSVIDNCAAPQRALISR